MGAMHSWLEFVGCVELKTGKHDVGLLGQSSILDALAEEMSGSCDFESAPRLAMHVEKYDQACATVSLF